MTTEQVLAGAYLAKGTIGNLGMPGAPVLQFALVVVPATHKVSGTVHVTQAVQGGSYRGQVEGTIYATGFGDVTQVVGLKGQISPDSGTEPIELSLDASMAINKEWRGKGGFAFANVHVENAPVKPL